MVALFELHALDLRAVADERDPEGRRHPLEGDRERVPMDARLRLLVRHPFDGDEAAGIRHELRSRSLEVRVLDD